MQPRASRIGWLLLGTLVLALSETVFHFWNDYRRTQRFVEELDAKGGICRVFYKGPQSVNDWGEQHEDQWYSRWLRTQVEFVRANGKVFDDAWVVQLERYPQISTLILSDTAITDTGMKSLTSMTILEVLILSDCQITDAGLASVKSFPVLRDLRVVGTQITDAGLSSLACLDHLEKLLLDDTQVTDKGLTSLRSLKSLQTLSLNRTKITDAGLEELAKFPTLKSVSLHGTEVTESGLERLKTLRPDIEQ